MNRLQDYLKDDRQWRRDLRIEHAKHQMRSIADQDEKDFWKSVLKANARDAHEAK